MAFQFENVYFLLILSAIPAIAILYQRYTVTNKKSILKFSSLESIQKTKQKEMLQKETVVWQKLQLLQIGRAHV